jgi:phosphoribosylformylglycinamidine synthase
MEDVRKAVTMDLKKPDNAIYLLGSTADELGASEYYAHLGHLGANVPIVDLESAYKRYLALHAAISDGLVRSCHDLSDGGLGVGAAEMCFAGGVGMKIDLGFVPSDGELRVDRLLFSESASRFLVEIEATKAAAFEKCMDGTVFSRIGSTIDSTEFTVMRDSKQIFSLENLDMKKVWQSTLGGM